MKTTTRSKKATEVALLKNDVAGAHQTWLKKNRRATLGDLLAFLQDVNDDFLSYDQDDLLSDYIHGLGYAAEYLEEWGDVYDEEGESATFGYRQCNVEEDISRVEDLIELVGESFKVKRLGKWKKPLPTK
ncbi:MAG TPA: hypothetical protein VH592_10525 [Gemmataceae bacterium]|jgi:hypothetical protein